MPKPANKSKPETKDISDQLYDLCHVSSETSAALKSLGILLRDGAFPSMVSGSELRAMSQG